MGECPECGSSAVYYSRTECASCGWHTRGATTFHRNFAPDPDCPWCIGEGVA